MDMYDFTWAWGAGLIIAAVALAIYSYREANKKDNHDG